MILFFSMIMIGCSISGQKATSTSSVTNHVDSTAFYKAKCDTLAYMVSAYETAVVNYENNETGLGKVIAELNDSIQKLNYRPLMTKEQFIELYKYDRLLKYYKICKRKSTQWKYYKGWSIRVFEQ